MDGITIDSYAVSLSQSEAVNASFYDDLRSNFNRLCNRRPWQAGKLIWCKYCRNKMSEHAMNGHLARKHSSILPRLSETENRSSKRGYDEIQADEPLIDQQSNKRQRLDADQDYQAMNGPIVPRPQTPPIEIDSEEKEQPIVQQGEYNLVHISDRELNKFLQMGRIRVMNGHLYMNDSNC